MIQTAGDPLSDRLSDREKVALEMLDTFSDEERMKVFFFYCKFCGCKQWRDEPDKGRCCCWNDE